MSRQRAGRILCDCLRVAGSRETAPLERVEADEWRRVLARAKSDGLAPYLHARLQGDSAWRRLPADVREALRTEHLLSAANALIWRAALVEVGAAMAAEDIDCLVLKGAHLALDIYPDPSLRPMLDLDLMVPREQLARGGRILRDLGYRQPDLEPWRAREISGRLHHAPAFIRRNPKVVIELHTRLTPRDATAAQDVDDVWQRSVPLVIDGQSMRALCPEDAIVYLCVHAACLHRLEFGLRPLLDLALLLSLHEDRIDWGWMVAIANESGAARFVHATLLLADEAFGVAPNPVALADLEPEAFDADQLRTMGDFVLEMPEWTRGSGAVILQEAQSARDPGTGRPGLLQLAWRVLWRKVSAWRSMPPAERRLFLRYMWKSSLDAIREEIRMLRRGQLRSASRGVRQRRVIARWVAGR